MMYIICIIGFYLDVAINSEGLSGWYLFLAKKALKKHHPKLEMQWIPCCSHQK